MSSLFSSQVPAKRFLSKRNILSLAAAAILGLSSALQAADGYATVNGTTTGGAGGPTVTVTTLAQLTAAIRDDVPRIVLVQGTINLGSSNVRFGSNKTIRGVGTNSGFIGNLKSVEVNNVIIERLNFTNPNSVGDGDGLTLQVSTHIWVDHCTFVDCGDGSLDLTHATDFVTVSWCKFLYTRNSGHNFVNLIGHSDNNASEDRGTLHITFHHNWWSTLCVERMPRVRFGRVHTYNNYFNAPGNNYCIRASLESQVLSEANSFENVDTPAEKFAPNGLIRTRNNQYVNCTGVAEFADAVFTPPYSYTPQAASAVKAAVIAGAGVGGSSSGGGGGTGGGGAGGGGSGGTTTTVQAEAGSVGGGTSIDSNNAGFTGTGFANFPSSGGFLQLTNVNGGRGGAATLTIRFALGSVTARTGQLLINGVARTITFAPTGSWTTWNTQNVSVTLTAGTTNTIRFQSNGQDLANIDQLVVVAP